MDGSALDSVLSILPAVNVPCADDGVKFTSKDRIEVIDSLLRSSGYRPLFSGSLSLVWGQTGFIPDFPTILLSCHVDSVYHKYFHIDVGDEILGTLDNSICNAVLVDLMLRSALPANVVVAFTGDEEDQSRGVDETMQFLTGTAVIPDMVVVMDVTDQGYADYAFTVENLFCKMDSAENPSLSNKAIMRLESLVRSVLGPDTLVITEAAADESWQYDEWNVNCLSLCIPTRPLNSDKQLDVHGWMHSDNGILVKKSSIPAYSKAVSILCSGIRDMANGVRNNRYSRRAL